MQALFGFLSFTVIIVFVVAVIKPRLVFRREMSRAKAAGIMLVVFFGVVALGMVVAPSEKKAEQPAGQETAQPAQVAAPAPQEVRAISISAAQLVADYKANELAAKQSYEGQVVEVTGRIDSIGEDMLGSPYLTLGKEFDRQVQCMFEQDDLSALARLQKGQQITIQGVVDGLMMNVLLDDCKIVR